MKAPAALIFAAMVAGSQTLAAEEESCGSGRDWHRYASAYFYNGALDAGATRVIGNAFAIHAVALTRCDPGQDCDDDAQSRWSVLFATAAHVIIDVCALQKVKPAGTVKLVVPASPEKASKSDFHLMIGADFCARNAEAANYSNAQFTTAREESRVTNAVTLPENDVRKNSDQWFFAADVVTPSDDYVRPMLIGPLRRPLARSKGIPLRFQAFQNAPADTSNRIEEGVWWTTSKDDYRFTQNKLTSAYDAEGWTTLKGASGSPVLESLSNGKVRAVGITTQFAFVGCTKAAGATRGPGSEVADKGGDPAAMTAADSALCLNDPVTGVRAKEGTTSFVPVLRFPPQLQERFAKLGEGETKGPRGWTRSPELTRVLRALVRARETASSDDKIDIDYSIKLLTADMAPHEITFILSRMMQSRDPRDKLSVSALSAGGCGRIEPPLGQPS